MSSDPDESDVARRPYALFVRVRLDHPTLPLLPALADAPETHVRPRSPILGTQRLFVSVFGGDVAAFESGLADDPTVTDPALVRALADRRIYRLGLSARGRKRLSPIDVADAYVHDAEGAHDGWRLRMEVPDRDSLIEFVRACRNAGVDPSIRRVRDTDGVEHRHAYGLSPEQERILRVAYETGYFDIPRKVSQTNLAESFDRSTSAVSQQLRRATAELIGGTLLARREY
ncbi:bacterio-opsin activator HTH domain-containing protein [Halovivax asiaticus JCM 14624]|uniref:Bacterio-opsin activator HTH domain-containing protein n=1 Tax=Halovivax asiaticus JCM 14624 TaxID=1227490 RepID=M0BL19_9EURY|nr:helix-turn-helix domain-containing protein [Halovivax asiaticus]ELZ10988.1 bacterio-opsin activator HTH domain-containing protein [Halovivax asiaticus JCM 14624]